MFIHVLRCTPPEQTVRAELSAGGKGYLIEEQAMQSCLKGMQQCQCQSFALALALALALIINPANCCFRRSFQGQAGVQSLNIKRSSKLAKVPDVENDERHAGRAVPCWAGENWPRGRQLKASSVIDRSLSWRASTAVLL